MDDRTRINEIIDTRLGNFGPACTLDPNAQGPETLGCQWALDNGAMWVWAQAHTDYDWLHPAVIANTYFVGDVFPDYTFTLRASDPSGIRKITVWIRERDVKRLEYEPRRTRLKMGEVVYFDLETSGSTARLEVEIEDNAGNVAHGAVYLAPRSGCPYG